MKIPYYDFITVEMGVPIDEIVEFIRDDPRNYNRVEEELQIEAVKRHSGCLEYMAKPSKTVIEAVVRHYPPNIGRIRKPTKEIQLLAVQLQPNVIQLFEPCAEAKSLATILA